MGERNRQMLAAFDAGASMVRLAADYSLALTSVRNILRTEQHRREVCNEPYYRVLRGEAV